MTRTFPCPLWELTREPPACRGVLVNVQMVEYHMQVALWKGRHYLVHEAEEIDRRAPVFDVPGNLGTRS